MSSSERQLRSSGQAPNISLDSLATDNVSPDERHNEAVRINECPLEEVFTNYRVGSQAEMIQIYKMLSILVHPDKQTNDRWKEDSIKAQQKLNEAREKFSTSDDIPEPERIEPPKVDHKRIWNWDRFVGAVRRLHIEPDRPDAITILKIGNEKIDEINASNGFPEGCGRFPLEYLRYNYRSAHAMLKSYNDSDDAEYKAHVTIYFRSFSETTEEFCTERGLPLQWAWNIKEINEIPTYLNEYRAADNEMLAEFMASSTDVQETDSTANPPENTQQPSGSDGQPTIISGTPPQGSNPSPQPAVSQSGAPQSTPVSPTSPSGQAPAYKRNIGRHYVQYLVTEDSGLHVWKKESECLGMDLTEAEFLIKPTREFVAQHKPLYDKVTWIAMPVDEAITHGAGAYPPVTMNVQWKGGLEETPLWRTDLIKMVGKAQVDQEIQRYLPHQGWVEYEGQKVWVQSPTVNGLTTGRGKAIQRLLNQRGKAAKAFDLATSAKSASEVPQTAVPQPAVPQPTAAQPMPAQSAASQTVDLSNPLVANLIQQLMQHMSQPPTG